mmetsp:Transcript_15103/g.12817  ORF Transcript_15103/g.12817 Transcript_15103/m.12817 type:complete len:301 (+) Transcript_15103:55-957(+)
MDKIGDTKKADQLIKDAEKKMKGGFFKNMFSQKSDRIDDAVELIKQAANIYKLAKAWEDAAKAYLRCAELQKSINEDPSEYYMEASNMQKKFNTADAVNTMNLAVEALCNDRRISSAARLKKQIAEQYEQEKNYLLAAKNYQDAVDLYDMEGESQTTQMNLLLKIPELKILAEENKEHIIEGIKIYEKVGMKFMENKLTKGSAKDLWFRICLLHLLNDDTVGSENATEKYSDEDPAFPTSREYKLVKALINTIEEKNPQAFSDECYEFNTIIPLDRWKTTVLNRIKMQLEKSIKNEFDVI